jgi:hypothetical protein
MDVWVELALYFGGDEGGGEEEVEFVVWCEGHWCGCGSE